MTGTKVMEPQTWTTCPRRVVRWTTAIGKWVRVGGRRTSGVLPRCSVPTVGDG